MHGHNNLHTIVTNKLAIYIYTSTGGVWSLISGWGLGERGDKGVLMSHGEIRGVMVPDLTDSVSSWGVGVAESSPEKVYGGAMMLERSSSSSLSPTVSSCEVSETQSAGGS